MKATRLPHDGETIDKLLSCARHSTKIKIKYSLERTSGGLWSNLLLSAELLQTLDQDI